MSLRTSQQLCPDLVGTWKLMRHHAWLPDEPSNNILPLGAGAQAIIMYAPDGYMSAQFLPSAHQGPIKDGKTQSSAGASFAYEAYMAYSGEYCVNMDKDGSLIVSHYPRITNLPAMSGVTQKRYLKIEDGVEGRKILTLRSVAPIHSNGEDRIHEVTLERFPSNPGGN